MTTIMILAGESSGELYGSLLARAIKRRCPDARIIGIGGIRMQEAGVELIGRISDAFGISEAFSSLGRIKTAYDRARDALTKVRPQVLVPIDYPDFNLRVSAFARALDVKVLYYVSPQVWAWRRGRIKKIACLVDGMAVILPFEEELYRNEGVRCEFVGHPIVEEIGEVLRSIMVDEQTKIGDNVQSAGTALTPDVKRRIKQALGFSPERPLLSFLPGSRPGELKRHLPLVLETIERFRSDPTISPSAYQFCVPLAPNTDEMRYRGYFEELSERGVSLKKGETVTVLAASDAAVVTSGTATLQTAMLRVPMVVIYKLSPLSYALGKRILTVKHISLVNILAGREVVRELLQDRANPDEIARELREIATDRMYREQMVASFGEISAQFAGRRPSDRVAELALEMAGRR